MVAAANGQVQQVCGMAVDLRNSVIVSTKHFNHQKRGPAHHMRAQPCEIVFRKTPGLAVFKLEFSRSLFQHAKLLLLPFLKTNV
jgi:hypothetical protein